MRSRVPTRGHGLQHMCAMSACPAAAGSCQPRDGSGVCALAPTTCTRNQFPTQVLLEGSGEEST